MKPPTKFVWRGTHHLYYGIFFMVFGILMHWLAIPNYPANQGIWFFDLLTAIGVFMVADDVIEHKITGNTPLRILYEKVIVPYLLKKSKGGE